MFQIEKTRMSKSMMLEHYFFINRKRINTANKALDLFILEALFVKIVEAILHPSTAKSSSPFSYLGTHNENKIR